MLNIQQQFINYNRSARSSKPIYIVIHDTGSPKSTAQNNHDYFAGGNRGASADFFVDSNNIIQIIDTDKYYSWAVGDGHGMYGITNANSVSIEMCINENNQPTDETINNTIDLVRYLMDKYNIGIEKTIRHYDCSHKICPNCFSDNNWARWYDFKNKLVNGSSVSGKWIYQDSKWWYKHSDGSYSKDVWEKIDNKWYLFDSEGYMLYDWKKNGTDWYYLGESNDGSMKTGWQYDKKDNKWYYFNDDGVMQTGWVKVSDEWYYLDHTGAMQTGWIKDNGKDYLLYSNGAMVHDTQAYGYKFDSNGVATKL